MSESLNQTNEDEVTQVATEWKLLHDLRMVRLTFFISVWTYRFHSWCWDEQQQGWQAVYCISSKREAEHFGGSLDNRCMYRAQTLPLCFIFVLLFSTAHTYNAHKELREMASTRLRLDTSGFGDFLEMLNGHGLLLKHGHRKWRL